MTTPITIPGFQFSGIFCGIKDNARKKDLATIYSEEPNTLIDGVFTTNKVCAAPVIVTKNSIKNGTGRLIVINSGVANACTGNEGMKNTLSTQKSAATLFGLKQNEIAVCSTGKIGVQLPMNKLLPGLTKARDYLSPKGFMETAKAIMATDQSNKVGHIKGTIGNKKYHLAVMTKGAGMLSPNMATMLTFVVTDLAFVRNALKQIFRNAVNVTLNRVTVDGDMSTNDTVLIMANAKTGNAPIKLNTPAGKKIEKGLTALLEKMARLITLDGEGATKCTKVIIKGAKSHAEARKIAYSIGNSPLVKTALFGCDPNWDRVMAAIGYSGATVQPEKIKIAMGPYSMVTGGIASKNFQPKVVSKYLKKKDVNLKIDMGLGKGEFFVFMSDLTYEYVHLNAEYHT